MAMIFSGDTAPVLVSLLLNGTAYTLNTGTDSVKAAWIDPAAGALITAALSQSSSSSGANWPNGVVAVSFDATNANLLDVYDGKVIALEVEVTKPTGKQTFRANYTCRKGLIP
jgi:hypothetical protein